VKAINPNTTGIMYLNSELDFQFYTLHGKLLEREADGKTSFLRDKGGKLVTLCNDGDGYCNITNFDWTQEGVRNLWLETITNATASGSVRYPLYGSTRVSAVFFATCLGRAA
jgi:hypothetical protein